MILQRLAQYYERLAQGDTASVPQEGFQIKEIRFIIVIDRKGRFLGIDDTREGEGKNRRGRLFEVPHEVKRSGKNAWKEANLLWDNEGYVLGFSANDSQKAKKQHKSFIQNIEGAFPTPNMDEGISALLTFFKSDHLAEIRKHRTWDDIRERGGNISFKLEGDGQLICQRRKVKQIISKIKAKDMGKTKMCLVSGEQDNPARLHAAIKGVRGAQTTGANIVSFNLAAFNSYGKEQGLNAPIGEKAVFAYTTALNTLLGRDSNQKMQVGDATTVFWAQKEHPVEAWFADFFLESRQGSQQDSEAIKSVYNSPLTGKLPIFKDLTPFYVLGLAPNASRLAVRFWYESTVGETIRHIRQHFEDIHIIHSEKAPDHLSLFRLLLSIAPLHKAENIPPNLAGEFMFAVLTGRLYPQTLLSAAVRRSKAEQDIPYERAAITKAFLSRKSRFYGKDIKEVGMDLDKSISSQGYRLGRLFSVLEKIQEEASPGINATIKDRFYGAASTTPVSVFPLLLKLKNHHLNKLEYRGRVVNFERLIGEIMAEVDSFPSHLSMDEQGRFAVGYYHQRQDFFKKKE